MSRSDTYEFKKKALELGNELLSGVAAAAQLDVRRATLTTWENRWNQIYAYAEDAPEAKTYGSGDNPHFLEMVEMEMQLSAWLRDTMTRRREEGILEGPSPKEIRRMAREIYSSNFGGPKKFAASYEWYVGFVNRFTEDEADEEQI